MYYHRFGQDYYYYSLSELPFHSRKSEGALPRGGASVDSGALEEGGRPVDGHELSIVSNRVVFSP